MLLYNIALFVIIYIYICIFVLLFQSDFLVFTEDGDDIDVGGNGTINVKAGDVKWNMGVDDWTWCDPTDENCKVVSYSIHSRYWSSCY